MYEWTDRDITTFVEWRLDHSADFDVAGIVAEIISEYERIDPEYISNVEFWRIVFRHGVSERLVPREDTT